VISSGTSLFGPLSWRGYFPFFLCRFFSTCHVVHDANPPPWLVLSCTPLLFLVVRLSFSTIFSVGLPLGLNLAHPDFASVPQCLSSKVHTIPSTGVLLDPFIFSRNRRSSSIWLFTFFFLVTFPPSSWLFFSPQPNDFWLFFPPPWAAIAASPFPIFYITLKDFNLRPFFSFLFRVITTTNPTKYENGRTRLSIFRVRGIIPLFLFFTWWWVYSHTFLSTVFFFFHGPGCCWSLLRQYNFWGSDPGKVSTQHPRSLRSGILISSLNSSLIFFGPRSRWRVFHVSFGFLT